MHWQPAAGAVRPMGLGEILDGGVRVIKRNLGPLVRITAVFVVPIEVAGLFMRLSVLPKYGHNLLFSDGHIGPGYYRAHSTFTMFVADVFLLLLGFALNWLAAGAIARYVANDYLGVGRDRRSTALGPRS